MTYTPSPAEIRTAAERERHDLLAASMERHLADIADAMRRYREDVRRIEGVYELRLSVLPAETASLRDQIIFWLGGTGVPPLGWTVRVIADQVGEDPTAVRRELDAMAAAGLARYTVRGRKMTWFLLTGPGLSDAAVESEAEADAAQQRSAFLVEGGI
jgi:hypothetical protein